MSADLFGPFNRYPPLQNCLEIIEIIGQHQESTQMADLPTSPPRSSYGVPHKCEEHHLEAHSSFNCSPGGSNEENVLFMWRR